MLDRSRWAPWSLSIFLHAAFVVGSLFIVWTVLPAEVEPERPVVIDFENPAPVADPISDSASDAAPLAAPDLPALPAPKADPLPEIDVAPPPPPATDPPPPPRYETTFVTAGASGAREIIYVVDASGSAISSFPYIIARLRDSLTALHPSQRFQILLIRNRDGNNYDFFHTPPAQTAPIPVDALPENITAAIEWIDTVVPGGPSDLPAALTTAMRLRADAVFVLARLSAADKETDSAALARTLDQLNPPDPRTGARRTVMRAMQMLDAEPSRMLQSIAETHGGPGAYTLVTLDDLKEPNR